MVNELLNSALDCYAVYATDSLVIDNKKVTVKKISESELNKISSLRSPNKVLAMFKMPKPEKINTASWVVALDEVRDPGNLGTIIRLCDWFHIPNLVCSLGTVDCFNPKVLQATMGSISRVNIVYQDLEVFKKEVSLTWYGAFMDGKSVYKSSLPDKGVLVMGNEAKGVSSKIQSLIDAKISIPQFGAATAESLNVAMATGILLNEIRRPPTSGDLLK